MNHLYLQIRADLLEWKELVGIFFLEDWPDHLPRTEMVTPLFNLPDERVECLLAFRQTGLVVGRGDAHGPAVRPGHGMVFSDYCAKRRKAIF
jgi:hypothetical protein